MITKSVHYAHPHSYAAGEAGYREEGCFYVRIDNPETGVTIRPFPTLDDAEAFGNSQAGEWSRAYLNHPLPGSTVSTVAVWAATHEERVAQWKAIAARHGKQPTLATLRKGWFGSLAPRYVAEMDDGEIRRVSFWQAKGKAYNFALGRKVAIGTSGKTIVRGHVEHAIPGAEPIRIEDPMQAEPAKVVRPSYKAALAALVEAVQRDSRPLGQCGPAKAQAYREACDALGINRQAA